MAGSEAEERIRAKAEAALREVYSSARIIHELVLSQGGVRIDLAAVTAERLIVVEIKSERDVLKRLPLQMRHARRVADQVLVVSAEKHLEQCRHIGGWGVAYGEDDVARGLRWGANEVHRATCNAPARLGMLWADELRRVSGYGGARTACIVHASDNLTGGEVRRRVCAAIRAREFPRADPPVLSELFPFPSVGRL